MTNEMITVKAQQRESLKAQIKALEAMVSEIDTELQSELDSRKVDEIDTGIYKVFYKLQEKNTFSQKNFKAQMPELFNQFCEKKVNTFFTITKK